MTRPHFASSITSQIELSDNSSGKCYSITVVLKFARCSDKIAHNACIVNCLIFIHGIFTLKGNEVLIVVGSQLCKAWMKQILDPFQSG